MSARTSDAFPAMLPALVPRTLRRLSRPYREYVTRGLVVRERAAAERLLQHLREEGASNGLGGTACVLNAALTRSDVLVAPVGDPTAGHVLAYLKIPLTASAEQSLVHHRNAIGAIHSLPELETVRPLVPRTLATGRHEGRAYHLETALEGQASSCLTGDPRAWSILMGSAAACLRGIHTHTVRRHRVDDALFGRLAGRHLEMLSELAAGWPGSKLLTRAVDRAGAFLRERLVGAELALGWIHGDFWPGNLLADTRTGTLAGIVDWDRSSSEDVPLHDLLHLLAYSRKLLANRELGEIVVECLLPAAFDARERALVDLAMESLALPRDPEFLRAMALLYWTRFAATNLTRYPRYRRDGRWLRKNVFLVLERNAQ